MLIFARHKNISISLCDTKHLFSQTVLTAKCNNVAAVFMYKLLGHRLLHNLLHLDMERHVIRSGKDWQKNNGKSKFVESTAQKATN